MTSLSVDRSSWVKLPHQVADGLKRQIAAGLRKPGERLPSSRQLSETLGVSLRVAQAALKILADEGCVSMREKSVAVVNAAETVEKNHRILLLLPGGVQFYMSSRIHERIWMRLNDAGYVVTVLSLLRKGGRSAYDLKDLKGELQKRYELVVTVETKASVLRAIRASGNPFVVYGGPPVRGDGCVKHIPISTVQAERAFAAHCRKRRVKSVLEVSKWRGVTSVQRALREAGIGVTQWIVPAPAGPYRAQSLEVAAFRAFDRRLTEKGTDWLPDVLYFDDDHACDGALTAFLYHAVRLPDDVAVVSVAHRGRLRALRTELTRIEYDAEAFGVRIADALLAYLRTGVFPPVENIGPVYRVGETFS